MRTSIFYQVTSAVLVAATVVFPAVTDSTAVKKYADTIAPVETIVVTATRSKHRISETPASISVITKSEIKASPAKTIEDLLATQTNVQPIRSVAIGEGVPSDIAIRGIPGALAASRTLILVDGIPTNASGTPFLIVNEVPMEAIDRIEIVRGPNSSLYGANALGGVINILTLDGYGKTKGDFVAETSYPFTAANVYASKTLPMVKVLDSSAHLAYWNVNGTIHGGTDKTSFLVSTGYRTIGDYLLRDYAEVKNYSDTTHTKNLNHDYEEFRFFGKVKFYTGDNNSISLNARFFQSELGIGKTKNILPDSQDIVTKGQKFLIGPQFKFSLSDNVVLRGGFFYRNVTGEFQNEGIDSAKKAVQTVWNSSTNDGQIESQSIITLGESNVVTTGFELLSNNVEFGATKNPATGEIMPLSYSTDKGIINGAVFAQEELKLFDKRLNIVPVVRIDYHSVFGSALSPKLGINFKLLDNLRFRASIGRSFRAPSLAELYMPVLQIDPNYAVQCNPDLKPEYLVGADGGFEAQVWKTIVLKCDVYYNMMNDMIGQKAVSDTTGNYVFLITHRNISKAWSDGIESELQWRPKPWFWISANNSIQSSLDEGYNQRLDYVPDYTFGCRSGFSWMMRNVASIATIGFRQMGPRIYLDFSLDYGPYGERLAPKPVTLDPYHTIDLSLKFTRSRYTLTFTGQNILNASWEEAYGTLAPGRFVSMKLGVSF
jgi:outer membrane receptor for ferrienterochelin and colicins